MLGSANLLRKLEFDELLCDICGAASGVSNPLALRPAASASI